MSTINSSDGSSRQDEVVRRNREDYRANESEMNKKHQKELKRLTEQHSMELEKLKVAHSNQMNEIKDQSRESISKRDHKYQQEMEDMRAMHRKQLQDTAGSATKTSEVSRKTAEQEVQQGQTRNEERVKTLSENYKRSLDEVNQTNSRALDEVRSKQQQAVSEYREKLNAKHQEEIEALNNARQTEVSNVEGSARNYRKSTQAQIKDQALRHFQNQQKASENLVDAVRTQRNIQSENEAMLRRGFKDGLANTRERYEESMAKEREAVDNVSRGTRADVYERVNGQMRQLERKNQELKEHNTLDEVKRKRDTDRQVANVRDAYQKNVEVAENARDEAIRSSNKNTAKDLSRVQKKNDEVVVNLNRNYLEKIDTQETRHKTDFDLMQNDFTARSDQTKSSTDQRVRHIVNETEAEKQRLSENHTEVRKNLALGHRDELNELRASMERDKMENIEHMKDMMRKQEVSHNDKMVSMTGKYEKEIARLNDEIGKTKRSHEEEVKRLVGQIQRQHQNELDSQQLQYQEKMRKAQAQHGEEIRVTNQRNQEKFDQLLTTVKKA